MCKPCVGTGVHPVTQKEIHAADSSGPHPRIHGSWYGFWPEEKSNAELRRALCNGCNLETCEIKCGYGREAQCRVDAGEMAPCMGLKQRKVTA